MEGARGLPGVQPHHPLWAAWFGAHCEPGALSWKATSSCELFSYLPVVPWAPWSLRILSSSAVRQSKMKRFGLFVPREVFQGDAAVPLGRLAGSGSEEGHCLLAHPCAWGSLLQMELLPRRQVALNCCFPTKQCGLLSSCVWSTLVTCLLGPLHHLCLPEPLSLLCSPSPPATTQILWKRCYQALGEAQQH